MKILVAIIKPEAIRKILDHLGIPSETPRRTSARSPPQAELAGTPDLFEVDYADPAQPRVVTKWVPKAGPGIDYVRCGIPRKSGLVFPWV
jgi:hypothetical protein